ncbi:unnamed protein product [Lepeophtheirus salmonis]|uniref:(salmon louse) hypothetical protein n=1 Tax=Lepeophtheirus salmonis TaxID=72036 RepID=A0A7R8HCJ2_LEPSM|nr:unnamed protein product [Lepeophtheirus salmonis]CAF3003396.1 unnamed protein product [Lepeophtheirus salmonis]
MNIAFFVHSKVVEMKKNNPKKNSGLAMVGDSQSLGIKIHPTDRVIFSSCLHIATISSATIMLIMNLWYCGYDITSEASETNIVDGIVRVMMVLQFTGIGVYAHRLSYRLFSHPKFLELMHLHSKPQILVSVARTHTISLRRFLSELESDAHYHDLRFRNEYYSGESSDGKDTLKKYFWKDTDAMSSIMKDVDDGIVTRELDSASFSIEETLERRGSNAPRLILNLTPERTQNLDQSKDIIDDSNKYYTNIGKLRLNRILVCNKNFCPCLPLPTLKLITRGVKVIQSIMPTPERVNMFRYLKLLPIEMTTYGHRISYGTMGTVLFGLFAAFVSKIVLQEINKFLKWTTTFL